MVKKRAFQKLSKSYYIRIMAQRCVGNLYAEKRFVCYVWEVMGLKYDEKEIRKMIDKINKGIK